MEIPWDTLGKVTTVLGLLGGLAAVYKAALWIKAKIREASERQKQADRELDAHVDLLRKASTTVSARSDLGTAMMFELNDSNRRISAVERAAMFALAMCTTGTVVFYVSKALMEKSFALGTFCAGAFGLVRLTFAGARERRWQSRYSWRASRIWKDEVMKRHRRNSEATAGTDQQETS